MQNFEVKLKRRNVASEELLDDLRRCAESKGINSITSMEYAVCGSFGVNTFLRRFESWNNALEKAGLHAPNRQNIPDAEFFENVANVWTTLGRQPVGKDMEKAKGLSVISLGAYERRFGSWNKALIAFSAYVQNGDEPSHVSARDEAELKRSKRTARSVGWRLRAQVLIRDNCICQMCGTSPAKDSSVVLHADHIVPWSKGGETTFENLQTLCQVCNIGKSNLMLPHS